MSFIDYDTLDLLKMYAKGPKEATSQSYGSKRARNNNLIPSETYADIFDIEPEVITTRERVKEIEESKKRQIEMDILNDTKKELSEQKYNMKSLVTDENQLTQTQSGQTKNDTFEYSEQRLIEYDGLKNGQDIVISSKTLISELDDIIGDTNGTNKEDLFGISKLSDVTEYDEIMKKMALPGQEYIFPTKTYEMVSYDHKCNPPRDPSDVFYEGRQFDDKDKLIE